MKKSLRLFCGIIPCLLLTSIAAAAPPAAGEEVGSLINYSSQDLSPDTVVVLNERPIFPRTGMNTIGSEGQAGTDFSDYEHYEAETREISDGIYEILDPDGTVIAIYGKAVHTVQPRVGWEIDWTVDAGEYTGAKSRFESYDGLIFSYDIDFSRTGSSKIGYANHDKKTVTWVGESTDGFDGAFSFAKNVGSVSLAIKNNSSNTITYTGVYYAIS